MHDLVIRSGVVVDGTPRERLQTDVAVDGGASPPSARSAGTARWRAARRA